MEPQPPLPGESTPPSDSPPNAPENVPRAGAPPDEPLGGAIAALLAWAVIGAINVIAVNLASPLRRPNVPLLLARSAYDLGYTLAIGVASCILGLAWARAKRAAWARWSPRTAILADTVAVAVVAYAAAFPILSSDLHDFSATLAEDRGVSHALARSISVIVVASGIPAAFLVGRLAARPRVRWIVAIAAAAAAAANHAVLTADYPGGHLYLAWAAAAAGGAAAATIRIPSILPRRRLIAVRAALSAAAIAGAWSVASQPRAVVLLALLEERGTTLAPLLMRLRTSPRAVVRADVPPDLAPWFADRSRAPSVPPTSPPSREQPIVILYTIDALRADVIVSGKYDVRMPEFSRLKQQGVLFTLARSAGTGTGFALSALFMGKYYSEQYWTPMVAGETVYPWEDDSLRFTDLLRGRGIRTLAFVGRKFMLNEYGIARGFEESVFGKPAKGRNRAPLGRQLGELALKRLAKHDGGPLLLWFHNMDAHSPFNVAGITGPVFERYVDGISVVDKEFGLLRKLIEQKGWRQRTTYIITADHGEAFHEHGVSGHSSNMYEEALRIPLIIAGPDVKPRAEGTPVSLIDVGPTILDMFGVPTPGSFLGQSLVPILRGEPAELTRPIAAETRLKQTLVLPSGLKLIRDQRLGTKEIYDLVIDPEEMHNLIDDPGADREAQMNLLAAFFDVHTLRRPGYTPPYRTW